jgi:rhodanese-related sulfurtransferase
MVGEISADELDERLEAAEDVQVVDIRMPKQYRNGHIPGAINVPFPELPQQVDEHDWGDTIVCACPKGESSLQAARMLESYEGVDDDAEVLNLDGGYRAWEHELEGDHHSAPF